MRKLLSLTFLFIGLNTASAQTNPVLTLAEQMPVFPGGESAMFKFLQDNLKYPAAEKAAGISGKCYISFVVEKDSSISEVKLLKGIFNGPGCDAEAIRVVKMMPKWHPGKQNGKPVRVQFNLPVKFTLLVKTIASETDTTFFNSSSKKCERAEADYYRIVSRQEAGFLVKEIDSRSGLPRGIYVCNALDPLVKNGTATYYKNGKKTAEGNFEKDKQIGTWTLWNEGSPDSLVVECFLSGMYENIYIPAGYTYNNKYKTSYKIEVMPEFPGGEREMMSFIQKNVKYPDAERNKEIMGTCYVTFVVEKDGAITDAKILRGVKGGVGLDQEALRVINLMPTWNPGLQYGRPVRVQFNIPIKFYLR